MSALTISVTLITAAIFAALGIWKVRRQRLGVEDFIVDRGSAGTGVATATIVASLAGAWILFSPAETGTGFGIAALIGYGLGSTAPMVAFAVVGPRMRQVMPQGHSMTEYTWYRFGPAMYLFAWGVMVLYMFTFLSAELTGIANALHAVADIPRWVTALIVMIGTLAYTTYGGIRASIFTDKIQFALIMPLLFLVLLATVIALGGVGAAFDPVSETAPHLLSITHGPGIEFGVVLIIAILGADLFHQGFWQRVFTCRDDRTLRKAFFIGGLLALPIVVLAGLFGIMAVGFGPVEDPSVALFSLVLEVLPTWMVMMLLVLATALVMSSMDTVLNGIASAVTSDLPRFRPGIPVPQLLLSSRAVTVLVALPAVAIAAQGYSVLYLFLIADLAVAGSAFPVFYGLYAKRLTQRAALTSCLIGIFLGALFFPKPDFSPWLDIPQGGRFLVSFGIALGASVLISVIWNAVATWLRSPEYDFSRLQEQVHLIEG